MEQLSLAAFAPHLNTRFRVATEGARTVEVELAQVRDLGSTEQQEQFSLIFHGPLDRFLPQGTYHLIHDRMGELDLFLVPVGKEEGAFLYQAVFNRVKARGNPRTGGPSFTY